VTVELDAAASIWRRIMCIAYEGVILFGVTFFFAYGFSAVTQFKAAPGPLRDIFQSFMVLVYAVYFGYFWSKGRRTLPMKTMQVRLVKQNGESIGLGRALWRYLLAGSMYALCFAGMKLAAISLLGLLIPVAYACCNKDRSALYDVLAGTKLIVDPPDRK
jgi:uncharacterized RDD family membrane protein YckC